METESQSPDNFNQTIERCVQAYRRLRAELKKDPDYFEDQENQHQAYLAFTAELPVLRNPGSIQLYVACIAKGVAIGAIDIADAGRFCHIANTALSIWKLSNLTIPAAQRKQEREQKKAEEEQRREQEKTTPHPSKGNHSGDPLSNIQVQMALQDALNNLPRFDEQKKYFQFLRNHGQILPPDAELREGPLAALHFIRMAQEIIRQETRAEMARDCKPAPEAGRQPAADLQKQPPKAA